MLANTLNKIFNGSFVDAESVVLNPRYYEFVYKMYEHLSRLVLDHRGIVIPEDEDNLE
jgi:hypothetical protein